MRRVLWSLIVLVGCGIEPRPGPTRFVGTVEGSKELIFIVADPTLTSAYACDGTTSPALFEWFTATSAAQLSATSDGGGATLDLDLDTSSGTLTAGTARDFTLVSVDEDFGLYRGSKTDGEDTYEVGIILRDDEIQNGVIGITTSSSSELTTIVTPRIDPRQTQITLLNDVRIQIAIVRNAYVR